MHLQELNDLFSVSCFINIGRSQNLIIDLRIHENMTYETDESCFRFQQIEKLVTAVTSTLLLLNTMVPMKLPATSPTVSYIVFEKIAYINQQNVHTSYTSLMCALIFADSFVSWLVLLQKKKRR